MSNVLYFVESQSYWSYNSNGVQVVIRWSIPESTTENVNGVIEMCISTVTRSPVLGIQLQQSSKETTLFEDNKEAREAIQKWVDALIGIDVDSSALNIFAHLEPIVKQIFEDYPQSHKVCYYAGFYLVGGYTRKGGKIYKIPNPFKWVD